MRSPNYAVRVAYKNLIQSNVIIGSNYVPVYYQYAPQSVADKYVIMTLPSHNELGTIGEVKTSTLSVQLKICTKGLEGNNGKIADDIADKILDTIYPNKVFQISLSDFGFTCFSTRLVNDTISNYQTDGSLVYIDRIITFEHIIYKN